jgi:hypothetical protein
LSPPLLLSFIQFISLFEFSLVFTGLITFYVSEKGTKKRWKSWKK